MTLSLADPISNPADGYRFTGFGAPHFTQVPDIFFDEVAPNLTEAELRVALYIIRRTFGWKKDQDCISLRQMVEGITTRDGGVMDRGTGMSKGGVVRGIKGLVTKTVIVAERNSSAAKGDEPTTYRLRFEGDDETVSTKETPPCVPSRHPRVYERDTQETERQETEKQGQFESSNDLPREKIVDNLGITGYLDHLIGDLSREFADTAHLASNCKQARNIFAMLDLSEEVFVERYVYQARQKTKRQTKVRSKMPYFFHILRELCGLKDAEEAS